MKIKGSNPETGEKYEAHSDKIDREFIASMASFQMAEAYVKRVIDNLDVSADIKSLLYSFSNATIRVGEFVVKIGRKIIDFVCRLTSEYPNATFGMIFGAIVGFLISSIPILGVVLGPLFTPIAIAIGIVGGLAEDIKDKSLARKIAEVVGEFQPLHTQG